ncbi:MAG: aminopeptidase P family protein [Caldilineaceae bacterium]|nr:aminopeptidase P family protein [Caldilineaceae bacterium]
MGYADLDRAQALLAQHRLDGLLVLSPENFEYFAGVSGFPVTMWRRAGPASALIAANGKAAFVVPETILDGVQQANPDAYILTYPLWIEQVDVSDVSGEGIEARVARATNTRLHERPETYDQPLLNQLLQDAAHHLNLTGQRIGIELEFAPAADVARLRELFPGTEFANSSPLIRELRLIKTPAEIDLLRRAVRLTEHGIMAALDGVDESTLAMDIRARFSEACSAEARRLRELGFQGARTTVHLGPLLWAKTDPRRTARRGDIIQFDSGVQLHGYKTDMGRTFTFGPANDTQRRIQDALLAGFQAGLEQLQPGRRFSDVFLAVQRAVRAAGFPSYARGHVGHSIGSDIDGEEWPWISAREERVLEPGMVLAFEVPYYVNGVGGFQNEDEILITENGHESFNFLPLNLVQIGG